MWNSYQKLTLSLLILLFFSNCGSVDPEERPYAVNGSWLSGRFNNEAWTSNSEVTATLTFTASGDPETVVIAASGTNAIEEIDETIVLAANIEASNALAQTGALDYATFVSTFESGNVVYRGLGSEISIEISTIEDEQVKGTFSGTLNIEAGAETIEMSDGEFVANVR